MDRYEEALERAKAGKPIDEVFPELKGTEDESVIKGLENFLWCIANGGMNDRGTMPSAEMCQRWLAYLERQKEQKPVDPSDEEIQRHQDKLYNFKVFAAKQAKEHHISFVHDFEWSNFCAEILSYFNEQQEPAEWSEEDEEMITDIISGLEATKQLIYAHEELGKAQMQERIDWLKSLRPSWKPSEEQMLALGGVLDYLDESDNEDADIIREFINDLKKL